EGALDSALRLSFPTRRSSDLVTVLARTAAQADAAATVIANAVDLDDPRIERRPACELKDDSDLGELLVTADVPRLGDVACHQARSEEHTSELQSRGHLVCRLL